MNGSLHCLPSLIPSLKLTLEMLIGVGNDGGGVHVYVGGMVILEKAQAQAYQTEVEFEKTQKQRRNEKLDTECQIYETFFAKFLVGERIMTREGDDDDGHCRVYAQESV